MSSRDVATQQSHKRPHAGSSNHIGMLFDVQDQEAVDATIARFFYANKIPFTATHPPFYGEMIQAINNGTARYKPPRSKKLGTTLIDKEKIQLEQQTAPMKRVWSTKGCNIVMDGRTKARNHLLLNVMLTCSKGPYLLKAIDSSRQEKTAKYLHNQLCDGIEDVGPSHVIHVVINAIPICKAIGMMMQKKYKHIFWTPCCVHSLNNALKNIGKFQWILDLIEKVRKIQMFIRNHYHTQAIYRKFAKVELLKPTGTQFASYFILLHHLYEVKGVLCSTVVCDTWETWRQYYIKYCS